ncbi:hypothetical protein B0A48_04732 [Cryoendolithus antarcticus]|uniref:CS domain-containing protein n=1 Tax=Cryoendolithus antarcticus TaxID=1507870 RepID=A0A1V8TDI8_9PEZI|nr:hypothetical protein B0A48_04732 [Cryoendolithus antarcticus]
MEQPKDTTDAKFAGSSTITPEVTWAQRSSTSEPEKNHIFLAIMVPDVSPSDIKLDIKADSLTFTGYSQSKKANYHVELQFFKEIDPSASKTHHSARAVEFVLQKKDLEEEYWPRLLKDKAKVHFLKTDFDKWVDEDEQNEVNEDDDYMSRMGGMGGGAGGMPGGMGGMGGMGGDGGFGGIDFSKLGGMGGGDMGDMGDMGGDDDEDDDEEDGDDEMPDLAGGEAGAKGEDAAASAGAPGAEVPKGTAKIEEVE